MRNQSQTQNSKAANSSQKSNQQIAGKDVAHESAIKHVSGIAQYIDDIAEPADLLHVAIGKSDVACGIVRQLDLEDVLKQAGVRAVISFNDIIGLDDIGPVFPGDPLFVNQEIKFHGQPLFAVAADSLDQARRAVAFAKIVIEEKPALLNAREAVKQNRLVRPDHQMKQGDADEALEKSPHVLNSSLEIGGQEHYYLEGQASLAIPTEDQGILVHCSTQHPSEVQKLIAEVLDIPFNSVTVETRRMGGGFGGKETNAAQWACIASILTVKTKRSVKLRLPRADDMIMTGKRHPFSNDYQIGFDHEGKILAAKIKVIGDCGCSPDLSDAIVDRAMFHSDNAYFLPIAEIKGHRAFTNKVSNTAFRGFGGPQGMMTIEGAMDDIARYLGEDPLDIRKRNLYSDESNRNITPYGQTVNCASLKRVVEELEICSNYRQRKQSIVEYNQENTHFKKGLALTPVKFGISFTVQHLNQAGALLHIYTDGSVHLNHGGTEMGQGLNTKVAQIVAEELQINLDQVYISATRTDKVPNTSPTAASSGTDLNGQAAKNAAQKIKKRRIKLLQ